MINVFVPIINDILKITLLINTRTLWVQTAGHLAIDADET